MQADLDALARAAARLEQWCREDALPLWYEVAGDPAGGYFEDLTPGGEPRKDQIRRVRVQPRQAYVYAHAAALGWYDRAREASDHGWAYLLAKAAQGDAEDAGRFDGIVHRLNPDGSVAVPLRDTYDHAFVVLAGAWRHHAFGDDASLAVARATLGFLDREMGTGDGTYREGRPASLPRRQNPHMHLFEATMALARETGERADLDRVRALYDYFVRTVYDETEGVVREFFTDDWALDAERGDLVEPGHMVEWVWLLDQYEALTGTDVSAMIERLYARAEELGTDAASGFLVDAVSLEPGVVIPLARRTWVQTEYIKASLVLARRGHEGMAAKAARLIDRLFETYLDVPVQGGYIDRFGPEGEVISEAMPTSTLYHLISAAAEAATTVRFLKD